MPIDGQRLDAGILEVDTKFSRCEFRRRRIHSTGCHRHGERRAGGVRGDATSESEWSQSHAQGSGAAQSPCSRKMQELARWKYKCHTKA